MGWKYIIGNNEIRYYSVSEEVKEFADVFFDFMMNLAPSVYIILFVTIVGVFILYLFFYMRLAIRESVLS